MFVALGHWHFTTRSPGCDIGTDEEIPQQERRTYEGLGVSKKGEGPTYRRPVERKPGLVRLPEAGGPPSGRTALGSQPVRWGSRARLSPSICLRIYIYIYI